MSKKGSSSSTGVSKQALPYLTSASSALTNSYNSNAGNVSNITGTLNSAIPTVLGQTLNNPTLAAANIYDTNTLNSNPDPTQNALFMKMLNQTNGTTANAVNGSIGTRGLAGGSAQTQLLADQLGKVDNSSLLSQYNTNVSNQNTAASNAATLANSQDSGIQALLAYLTGTAELPGDVSSQYASGLGNLWSKSTTTTSTPSTSSSIASGLGTALSLASLF